MVYSKLSVEEVVSVEVRGVLSMSIAEPWELAKLCMGESVVTIASSATESECAIVAVQLSIECSDCYGKSREGAECCRVVSMGIEVALSTRYHVSACST